MHIPLLLPLLVACCTAAQVTGKTAPAKTAAKPTPPQAVHQQAAPRYYAMPQSPTIQGYTLQGGVNLQTQRLQQQVHAPVNYNTLPVFVSPHTAQRPQPAQAGANPLQTFSFVPQSLPQQIPAQPMTTFVSVPQAPNFVNAPVAAKPALTFNTAQTFVSLPQPLVAPKPISIFTSAQKLAPVNYNTLPVFVSPQRAQRPQPAQAGAKPVQTFGFVPQSLPPQIPAQPMATFVSVPQAPKFVNAPVAAKPAPTFNTAQTFVSLPQPFVASKPISTFISAQKLAPAPKAPAFVSKPLPTFTITPAKSSFPKAVVSPAVFRPGTKTPTRPAAAKPTTFIAAHPTIVAIPKPVTAPSPIRPFAHFAVPKRPAAAPPAKPIFPTFIPVQTIVPLAKLPTPPRPAATHAKPILPTFIPVQTVIPAANNPIIPTQTVYVQQPQTITVVHQPNVVVSVPEVIQPQQTITFPESDDSDDEPPAPAPVFIPPPQFVPFVPAPAQEEDETLDSDDYVTIPVTYTAQVVVATPESDS